MAGRTGQSGRFCLPGPGRLSAVTLGAVANILRENDLVEDIRIACVDPLRVVKVGAAVHAMHAGPDRFGTEPGPAAGRVAAHSGEEVASAGAVVVVASQAVVGVEGLGVYRAFVQMPDGVAMADLAVCGDLLILCFCADLEGHEANLALEANRLAPGNE